MEILEKKVPIEPSLVEELIGFWETIFDLPFARLRSVLLGEEIEHNRNLLFLAREGKRIIGTCHLTIESATRKIAGLGEVAVDPEFRGQGIANALCVRARDVFREQGGRAIFLGTVVANAARLYSRLGWRTLAGTNIMLMAFGPHSSEDFLVDHFRKTSPVSVIPATAADRVSIIPLLISPHDWYVLDGNVRVFSTQYVTQDSCMGLYPQYQTIRQDEQGNWFVARTEDGSVVGISTVRLDKEGKSQIDGFTHPHHLSCMGSLIGDAMRWGAARGASVHQSLVLKDNTTKLAQFESVGFQTVAQVDSFELDGHRLRALRLEMPAVAHKIPPMHLRPRAAHSNR